MMSVFGFRSDISDATCYDVKVDYFKALYFIRVFDGSLMSRFDIFLLMLIAHLRIFK